jgi:radical SAM protein with 4Fe4S-binding SPASM domain
MKECSQELGIGNILHFPDDIQFLQYEGRVLAIAVNTANWLVLHTEREVSFLESLRCGKTVGEVLSSLQETTDKQLFLKLLSAIMARRFAGLYEAPEPEYVQGYRMLNIYLTNACNLSCTHCFMKAGKKLEHELNADDWIRVLNEFAQAGGKSVTLTGGEPLMTPDFQTIIKAAHGKGLQSTVLTNGILWTDELIDQLSPLMAEVQISIDGVDDESNAKVRKAGIFEQLVTRVIRFANNGVRVSVATTFTNENIATADKYVELVNRINEATPDNKVFFKLTKKILPGRETQYTEEENRQYEARIREVENLIDANAKYQAFMEGHTPNLVARNCGFGGLSIAADGNVYFCNRVLEVAPQGYVKDHPLTFFLEKGETAHLETAVEQVESCRNCALRYICGGGCRIDEYDFKGKTWGAGQVLHQLRCKGPNDHLLKMMVESYEYQYSF